MQFKTLLTEEQLAQKLNISKRTIQSDRQRGGGIPFIKIGRSVRYDENDVMRYLENRKRTSTSDLA